MKESIALSMGMSDSIKLLPPWRVRVWYTLCVENKDSSYCSTWKDSCLLFRKKKLQRVRDRTDSFVRGRGRRGPAEIHGRFLNGFLAGLPWPLEERIDVRAAALRNFPSEKGRSLHINRKQGQNGKRERKERDKKILILL